MVSESTPDKHILVGEDLIKGNVERFIGIITRGTNTVESIPTIYEKTIVEEVFGDCFSEDIMGMKPCNQIKHTIETDYSRLIAERS